MSGGVDSSVAAYLLKQQGYTVVGVTLQMWSEALHKGHLDSCPLHKAVDDAKAVAAKLGIEHIVLNCEDEFTENVVDYFVQEYTLGKTPNPCIQCNKHIKFGYMLNYAEQNGFDYIATGHYAKIEKDANGIYTLRKSEYDSKDQTYVLYNLTQPQLAKILMPLGDYSKEQIREIAEKEFGMYIAEKKDSMEICFIPNDNHTDFIGYYSGYKPKPGNFTDTSGNVIGRHNGIINFTIGQRKGLGMTFGKPMFVTKINPDTDEVILGENGEQYSAGLVAENVTFTNGLFPDKEYHTTCKTRYSARPAKCLIEPMADGCIRVTFEESQRAVTPGQSVVFYDGDVTTGGGIIKYTF